MTMTVFQVIYSPLTSKIHGFAMVLDKFVVTYKWPSHNFNQIVPKRQTTLQFGGHGFDFED